MASSTSQSWVVLKFGGTSVTGRDNWNTIATILGNRCGEGLRPMVVCSAISGVSNALESAIVAATQGQALTDTLTNLRSLHEQQALALGIDKDLLQKELTELEQLLTGISLTGEVTERLHARIMAYGEGLSCALGAAFLNSQGLDTQWTDSRSMLTSVPIAGDLFRTYLSAHCPFEADSELRERLDDNGSAILLTQGFIASHPGGDTVLLGRGGSDTSAAYLAAKISAQRLEIWTDVPGMFTANPKDVPGARLIHQLDYDEAQEIASSGAKVLHPRCIEPVRHAGIPLRLKCTQSPEATGTRIAGDAPDTGPAVKAISTRSGILLVSMETIGMWQQVGFLARAFTCFQDLGLSIDLISTSESNVTVSLDPEANELSDEVTSELVAKLGTFCQASLIGPCATVSLVGRKIRAMLHRLTPALKVFEEREIHLVSQAASDLNLTLVVNEGQGERLVRQLHDQLFPVTAHVPWLGPAGDNDEDEMETTDAPWWLGRRDELLEAGAAQSPLYVYDPGSIEQAIDELAKLSHVQRIFYAIKANPHPAILQRIYDAGLGFECVSPGEIKHITTTLPGISKDRILFTPNFAPKEEYAFGLEQCAYVTLDNLFPLQAWPEVFAGRDILIRIDPGQGRGHHAHVRTAGARSKFGVSTEQLDRLQELTSTCKATVIGLHAHSGSGILSPDGWTNTAHILTDLVQRFPDVRSLDIGGGLGVREKPGQTSLDLTKVNDEIAFIHQQLPDLELWMEPGRFLVARAGVLLTRVTQTKQKGPLHYVGVDTGMNTLLRPALYGAYHHIVNLSRLHEAKTMIANIVGPICETGDTLGRGRRIAPAQEGDIILIATAGAYGRSMSSNYNLREPASEVMLPQQ